MIDINLSKTCADVINQTQKTNLSDFEIVDQIQQLDSQWRKLRTKLGKLNRSVNFASKEFEERKKLGLAFQNLSESTEVPTKLLENLESITKADVKNLTIDQIKKLSRHVGTIVKQTKTELRNLKTEMLKHIEKNSNIVSKSVQVSKFYRKIR
jgi:seryl-tRNA synthetase